MRTIAMNNSPTIAAWELNLAAIWHKAVKVANKLPVKDVSTKRVLAVLVDPDCLPLSFHLSVDGCDNNTNTNNICSYNYNSLTSRFLVLQYNTSVETQTRLNASESANHHASRSRWQSRCHTACRARRRYGACQSFQEARSPIKGQWHRRLT